VRPSLKDGPANMRPSGKASHGSLAALSIDDEPDEQPVRSIVRTPIGPSPSRVKENVRHDIPRRNGPHLAITDASAGTRRNRITVLFFFPHTHHDGGPAAPLRVGSTVSLRSNNVRRNEAPFAPLGDGPQKTRPQPNRLTPRDRPANRSGQQHPQRATTNILQQGSSFASERSSQSPFQERSQP